MQNAGRLEASHHDCISQSFFLNGNTVYNLDTSSSLIHALTILHAWVHSIRKFLFIHMGAHVPSLGENKIN